MPPRPDLAVGAIGGRRGAVPLAAAAARAPGRRRGLSRPRRRLALRQVDELEAVDDDRVRASLQPQPPAHASSTRSSPTRPSIAAPKPPNLSRIVEINRGPFVGAAAARRGARGAARGHSASRRAAGRRRTSPVTARARSACLFPASSFATKAGFVLDAATARSASSPRSIDEARASDPRASLGRASSTSPGSSSAAATSATESVTIDELEALMAAGRRGDRRAREGRARHGLHPWQPQRPLPAAWATAAPTSRRTARS